MTRMNLQCINCIIDIGISSALLKPIHPTSIPGFSPSCSLNCSSSKAQGVSREFVWLWQGRVVFPQCSLKIGRLSTPGLSAGPLSSSSSTAGNAVRLACIMIWSDTHTHTHAHMLSPMLTHSTCNKFSASTYVHTCVCNIWKAGVHTNVCM